MTSLSTILKTEFFGMLNFTVLLIILVSISKFFITPLGVIVCSAFIAAFVVLFTYFQKRLQEKSLLYGPSDEYKNHFEKEISACGMQVQKVVIKYASMINGEMALNNINMIILDPNLFSSVEGDPQAIKVKNIFQTCLLDQLTEIQRERYFTIQAIFSPEVQAFIFRHELGHTFYNYAYKKMIIIGISGFIFTYVGMSVALLVQPFVTIIPSIFLGMFCAGITDVILSYASNIFFKIGEEKKADEFAVRYSSAQEVNAAADFFQQHIAIVNTHNETQGILRKVPKEILSGHPETTARVAYLRKMAALK